MAMTLREKSHNPMAETMSPEALEARARLLSVGSPGLINLPLLPLPLLLLAQGAASQSCATDSRDAPDQ